MAKRDEEVRMLKDAYKERMREKEEEFKKRWAAENEAEALAHKLNAAESTIREKDLEVKKLHEQVHKLEAKIKSLKEENEKLKKKHGNNSSSSSEVVKG